MEILSGSFRDEQRVQFNVVPRTGPREVWEVWNTVEFAMQGLIKGKLR